MTMDILIVCKLFDHTLKENVLSPLLSCKTVKHIYVLRDKKGDEMNGRVTYLCPQTTSTSKLRHLAKIWRGIKAVRKYEISAIIGVLNTPHGFIGRAISILTHTPYIHMTIAGHREYWVDGPFLERINLRAFGNGGAITVSGSQTQQYLINKGIRRDMIFILPNLPNEAFTKVPYNEERHYDIISFSRIDLNKNLILLIKALARLKGRFLPKVAIAGDGDQLKNIKAASQEYGVAHMIDFLGFITGIDNKVKLLSDSKIFISCSKGEGFPVSLLEAMNCGCVPVVSNVGDIVDVIKNGKNGYIFNDFNDETEFTGCLEKLLADNDSIIAMRQEAYKIKEEISVANNGKVWDNVFTYIRK